MLTPQIRAADSVYRPDSVKYPARTRRCERRLAGVGLAHLGAYRARVAVVAAYRTPDERFDDLAGWPYEPRYVEQDGLRMHYVEEGAGNPILLLHGEPTWGFLYRRMIPGLSAVGRVVVPDLLGFGRSDKPVDQAAYSYDMHYGVDRAARARARPRVS